MSLVVFSSDIENVSADISSAQLVDLTNYTTQGVARNSISLYVFLYKRDSSSSDTAITIDNTAPLTATFWSFSLPSQDGLFIGLFFGFPIYPGSGTFTLHQCVYYSGNLYYVNVASTTSLPGTASWTQIPVANIPSVVPGLSSNNVSQTQTYNFSAAHSATGVMASALADFGLLVKEGKCKNWQQASEVLTGGALIDSAYTNFRAANYVTCQEIMDFIQAQTSLTI